MALLQNFYGRKFGDSKTHLKDVHFRSRARFAADNKDENVVVHLDGIVAGESCRFLNQCRRESLDDVLQLLEFSLRI